MTYQPDDIACTIKYVDQKHDEYVVTEEILKLKVNQMNKLVEYLKSNFVIYEHYSSRRFKEIIRTILFTAIKFTKENK